MNKILAVFHKEYLETKTTTLVFLLVGVLFPLTRLLNLSYNSVGIFADFVDVDPFTLGGVLAVWINAAFLTASTFARERENGTFETLRRVAPDWRVAAAGKFGCVLASTLALAAFFCVESIVAALIAGQRPFAEFAGVLSSRATDGTFMLTLVFIASTVCWGVFWTARSARQMSAIFRAVLCPLLAYLLVGVVGLYFFHFDSDSTQQAVVDLIVGASGLLALVAAPFKGRFGYRENEKRAALKKTESGSGSWNQVDLDKKGGRFSALVSLAFADASLLFRSSASVLFELAILFAAGALAFKADYLGADIGAAGLGIWATVFVLYYSCFASGLFSDSKRKDSIVRERLSVKPGSYWLADAFAAFLVWTALLAALFFVDDYEEFHLYGALEHYLVMGTILFLFYGVSLWSASLKGSRIVVWAVLFATALSLILCWEKCFTHIELSVYDDHDETVAKQTLMLAFVVETLVFIVASRGVATARIRNRKARWSVAFPIVLTVATVAFALCPKLPKLPEESRLREIDAASCPQSQEEYDRLVADAVKSVESVVSSPLFNTIEGTDSVAVELNDLRERFVDACELTKKRAASFVDVENAERAFYSALRKALDDTTRPAPEPNEPNGLLDFLCEIPSLRPTAEQQTDNNYAFALYGNLASGVKTPEAGAIIAKARAKNDKVWKRALWNAVQFMPDRLDYQLKKLQGEFVFQRRFPSSSFSDRKSLDYNAILNALDPSMQLARNEVDRRLLYLRLAAKTPRPDGSVKPWESLSAIYLRGLIPEPPQGPLEPFVQPLIAQPPRFDLDKSADPSRLVAFLDESGRGLTIPKLSERFVQNKARVVRKETSDQQSAVEPDSEHKAYYVADAPLRIAASAPKYAPDMTNDGIVSLEISGVYPLFESGGSPLLDDDNHRYYGVIYSDVDEYGEPIVFAPEPTVEKPGFDCGDAKLLTSRENGPSDEPQISRVRAFLPFQADGENSYVVPNLWAIRSFEETDGKKTERVKYVDSSGKEPFETGNARPKYAEKRGVFLDARRKVDFSGLFRTRFPYEFVLPPEIVAEVPPNSGLNTGRMAGVYAANIDDVRVVRKTESGEFIDFDQRETMKTESGEYVAFEPKDLVISKGKIYTSFPAAAFVTSSLWVLDPSPNFESTRVPVVIVEPLEPRTFTVNELKRKQELESKTDAAGTSADKD